MASDWLTCPVCKEELPYDHKAKRGEMKVRRCACGYVRTERPSVEVTEYFPRHPESAPIPKPKHPGEGGDGPQ